MIIFVELPLLNKVKCFAKQDMNYNCIILNLFILHYLMFYTILYYILHLFYNLFTVYVKVAMVRLNSKGLHCGNQTILGKRLVREADGEGDNTIQGLFSSDLHFL